MAVWYELPHIWHQPRGTRPYTVHWCRACGFGSLQPRPSRQELAVFYGDAYFSRYARESSERYQGQADDAPERPGFLDRLRVNLAWRLDRSRYVDAPALSDVVGWSRKRFCDIGCGNGGLLVDLRALGHDVVGIESDEDARRRAVAKGLNVYPGYAEDLPEQVQGQAFDAVLMTHVLEHCLDPVRALQNAAGMVLPGGCLVVEVPNNDALAAQSSGPAWFHGDAGRHLNFFTPGSLARAVAALGFTIEQHRFHSYAFTFLNYRVAAEQVVWDRLYAGDDAALAGGFTRNSKRRQWMTLARTALAAPARKYEVVAIIARRRPV